MFMQKISFFFSRVWKNFILSLTGEMILAFALVFHVIFPLANIFRAVFSLKLTAFFLFCLILSALLLYLVFLFFPKMYKGSVFLVFGDFFTIHMGTLCFGGFLIRNYPRVFGCYIFLSSASFLYFRENPENFGFYVIYCLCVIFRNVFLMPYLGYSLLITLNKKKKRISFRKREK